MGLFSVIVMITATAFVASRHNPVFVPSSQQQQHSPLKTNHPLKAATTTTTSTTTHAVVDDDSNWLQERLQSHDLQVAHFPTDAATTTTTAGSCCLVRGIQTLRDRQPGELLLSVPSSYVLFPQKIWNEYPHIRRAVQKAEHAALLLSNSQILTLALGILQLRQVDENDPCICSLPEKQYSVPLMPDAIKDCLPPTYQRAFDRIQKQHNDVYETVYQSLQDQQDEQQEESSQQQQQQQILLLQPPSRTDFLWAVASIQSRSFNADGSNQDDEGGSSSTWRIMLPGIDLINHKFGNEASLQYNADERQYEFRSNVSFDSGDEVTYSYGHDADNLSLLMNFGFCIPNNPQRLISFDLDNVLQAAQSLVPNIYPDPILAMLKTQLQLQQQQQQGNKLLFSEGSLFGYDGNTRVAAQNNDDLVKATSMVQALGEQLAKMPLTGLDAAMVPKMLVQRKYDLHESLKRLEKVKVVVDWQPFVSSIRTLLQDELQTLDRL